MTDPGDLVGGRYRLAERVGAGAMGVVWRALDERLGRTVAVKQLALPSLLAGTDYDGSGFGGAGGSAAADANERVMREGRIAARLHHPNAISVFDVVDHDGTPWLVMEYLPARSLATVLAEHGPLPSREVAAIGRQLADALAAAHAAGIVHRDVKPANVLLGDGGIAKLTDFGISRAADDVTVTRTGVVSGTPAYLAPEVARGAEPGPASDVFALGSTLYAAVEGQPPFGTGDNALAVLHQVARGQVLPPRQAGPLGPLLMRLLRAEPAERPTMAEVRDALAALLAAPPAFGPPVFAGNPVAGPPVPFRDDVTFPRLERHDVTSSVDDPWPPQLAPTRMDLPPVGGPPYQPQPPDASDEERDRRPALLIAGGVALAVLTVLFILAATAGPERPAAQQPAPSTSATPGTTTAPPSTTTTPPPTTTRRPPTTAELQRAVTEYYGLLPDHPDQAWQRLGPGLQARGYDAYREFWKDIESVQAVPTKADPATMTVRVLVVFRRDDRRPQAEVHDLVLVQSGDALLIERDNRVSVVAAPTTTRKRRG